MKGQTSALIVVGAMILLGLGAFLLTETPLAWGIIPASIGSAWMLGNPKRLLAGYWLWAVFAEYFYHMTGIRLIRHVDEIIMGLILIALTFEHAVRRKQYPDLRGMIWVFLALSALYGMSYFVNRGTEAVYVGATFLQYFRFFILGFLAYTSLTPGDYPKVILLFLLTLGLQMALNLSWLLNIYVIPHPGIYTGVDFAVGTMGTSTAVAYATSAGIVLCLSLFQVFHRMLFLAGAALLTVSLVFCNTLHAYVFLAIMVILVFLIPSRTPLRRAIVITGVSVVLSAFALLLNALWPEVLNLEFYWLRGQHLLTGRKMDAYIRHLTELPRDRDVPVFLLGAGPGNLGTSFVDQRNHLHIKYHGWSFETADLNERASGSIVSHTQTGLLAIWGDLGPIAFLLYWGCHVYALIRVASACRRGLYRDPWQQGIAISFVPVMVLFLMVAVLTDMIHIPLWSALPWVWAGMVWTPYRAEETVESAVAPSAAEELEMPQLV